MIRTGNRDKGKGKSKCRSFDSFATANSLRMTVYFCLLGICAQWFLRPLKRAGTRGCVVAPVLRLHPTDEDLSVGTPRLGLAYFARVAGWCGFAEDACNSY